MMTKTTKTKQAGDTLGVRAASLGAPIVSRPSSSNRPSAKTWSGVQADDIGGGYESVSLEESFPETKFVTRTLKVKAFKNKFVRGKSPFVSYTLKTKVATNQPKAPPTFNAHTKVSKATRHKFNSALAVEIQELRDMILHELLPVSLSLESAADELRDMTTQLVDEPVSVPLDFIKTKALQAIQLRLTRYFTERFKLTPEEAVHMLPEFVRILNPSTHEKV